VSCFDIVILLPSVYEKLFVFLLGSHEQIISNSFNEVAADVYVDTSFKSRQEKEMM
jgi:hypothetical protein